MPRSPKIPKPIPQQAAIPPSPKPREAMLEDVREEERKQYKRRRGYSNTVMTRGGLGVAQTQRARALGE